MLHLAPLARLICMAGIRLPVAGESPTVAVYPLPRAAVKRKEGTEV
jgi:hypothetical protein